jgi:hypothetical protein
MFLLLGCLVFIKKGGEIRLLETLATNPDISGERCQNLIPGKRPGDDKNLKHERMNSIHLTHHNFIMPLMPMCMCR